MNHPLDGWRLKLERGKAQSQALHVAVSKFFKAGRSHRVILNPAPPAGTYQLLLRVLREPPLDEWALAAGECVGNYRAALDHLVYLATVLQTGACPPQLPKGVRIKDLAFPIFSTPWKSAPPSVSALSDPLRAAIAVLQPFSLAQHPEFMGVGHEHPLRTLQRLSNTDKHRMIPVVLGGSIGNRWQGGRFKQPTEIRNLGMIPFTEGAVVAHVDAPNGHYGRLQMKGDPTFSLMLEKPPQAPLVDVLAYIGYFIEHMVVPGVLDNLAM